MTEDKLFDNLSEQLFPNKMSWGGHAEDVSKLVVAAYNRGIDDSVELLQDNVEYDVEACYKLKIRD